MFRVLSEAGLSNWRAFAAQPLASQLMAEGLLVRTSEVPEGLPALSTNAVIEHEKIGFVSYAYEWPFFLLKRAAMLHLDLMERLIPEGFILRDATPSNIMFRGIQPVFIDVSSIAPHCPGDPWQGFKQFLETMLYPLLLTAHKGMPYQGWLRGLGVAGLPVSHVARLFGVRDLLRPQVRSYVKLAALFKRLAIGPLKDVTRSQIQKAGVPPALLLRNVLKLKRVVRKLRPKGGRSLWIDYDRQLPYAEELRERKRAAVLSAVDRFVPRAAMVWDLGCNTGEYSLLVSPRVDQVIAMDEDEAVVDDLCRRCEEQRILNILPLVVDIANPSPAQGWRGAEFRSLAERGKPDLILALGLLHHLILTKNLPADEILEEVGHMGRYCLIEYVSPDDPMVERLCRNFGEGRNEIPDRETFETQAGRHFHIQDITELTNTRALYMLEAKRYSG